MTQRHPVVDGDDGANIYGTASTARGACRVAERYYTDGVSHAELYGPIKLSSGETLPLAWVVFSKEWLPEAQRYVKRLNG